ncbi:hypothetical protein BGZ54_001248 [Gamsiella multidivaricata]|nr:hypothetical protein BGZ54_001248 [Gamsiella multidivaricata]
MNGGAVAGLIIGLLLLLICSVVGGMVLLKKRRKRMMAAGRGDEYYKGYPGSEPKDQQQQQQQQQQQRGGLGVFNRSNYSEEDDERKGLLGGFAGIVSGLVSRARKTVGGNNSTQPAPIPSGQQQYQQQQARAISPSFASISERGASPMPTGGLPRMLDSGRMANPASPIPGRLPTYGSGSSFQTHQSGALPPTGPLPTQGLSQQPMIPFLGYSQAATLPVMAGQMIQPQQQQQQQPLFQQQTPLQQQPITAPASQPYVYQPGTGLVSVPLTLPPRPPPMQQPVHQQQIPLQYAAQPYQATPAFQQQQQPIMQFQAPVSFPPPQLPATTAASSSVVPVTTTSTSTRPITPEASTIFLPGDASRPLLGQGLFKIVPDAEDHEEANRVSAVVATPDSVHTTNTPLQLDLNINENLLSSVITYENQDQRFQALEARRAEGSTSSAGPLFVAGKEEHFNEKQELDEEDYQQDGRQVVIVGSDIVLEPLPSAKAASKAAQKAALAVATVTAPGADSSIPQTEPAPSSSSVQSGQQQSQTSQRSSTGASVNADPTVRPKLNRVATIGSALPTMGTEEYLERTDDKEEYSFGLHGDRRVMAGSSAEGVQQVVHPPTRTELGEGAQGGFEDVTAGASSAGDAGVVGSQAAAAMTPLAKAPPPIARNTRPNVKK